MSRYVKSIFAMKSWKNALISALTCFAAMPAEAAPPPFPVDGFLSVYAVEKMDIQISANGNDMVGTQNVNVTFVAKNGERFSLGTVTLETSIPLFNQTPESLAAARIGVIRDLVNLETRGFPLTDLPLHMRIRNIFAPKSNTLLNQFLLGALRKKLPVSHRQPARLFISSNETTTRQYTRLAVSPRKNATPPPIPTQEYAAADTLLRSNYEELSVNEIEHVVNRLLRAVNRPTASPYVIKRTAAIANELRMNFEKFHEAKILTNTMLKEIEAHSGVPAPESSDHWNDDKTLSTLRKNIAALRLVDKMAMQRVASFKVCERILRGAAL